MKLLIFACLLGLALGHEVYTYYTPSYGYYPSTYARAAGVLPLAYSRLVAPAAGAAESHLYHSVATPNSFQQQYRSDYKPLTYEYHLY
ncbi:GL18023 [Drosophila persimilis]|uniref:Uncharacterized protein n=2 Tax=pseudoobscura subgroup TaxID=32358 RepID=B5DR18_DROPS|nr:uncharacterized protein LOC6599702 [Drosophila persimilis]XP_002135369.1 uncharacterized protein LOC6900004 [Drosophila pseudoobscura]XP_017135342.1 uncharacterized protein LOC108151314 [Drosophila miranda]EDW30428.1 GL18023 [Drosophila persimilis]